MTIQTHNPIPMTCAAGGPGQAPHHRPKMDCQMLRLSDRADLGPAGPGAEIVLADLADFRAVPAMLQDVDAVLDCGGASTEAALAPILQANIIGLSNIAMTWWDNSRAWHIVYLPQDSSDGLRDALLARTSAPDQDDPTVRFQGGALVRAGPFDSTLW